MTEVRRCALTGSLCHTCWPVGVSTNNWVYISTLLFPCVRVVQSYKNVPTVPTSWCSFFQAGANFWTKHAKKLCHYVQCVASTAATSTVALVLTPVLPALVLLAANTGVASTSASNN